MRSGWAGLASICGRPGRGAAPAARCATGARTGTGGERAHLLLHLLQLGSERPDLRLDAVEAAGVGGADGRRGPGDLPPGCRRRGSRAARQRFERSDHHLHVDQLLLELLDALAQCRSRLPGARGGGLGRPGGRSLCAGGAWLGSAPAASAPGNDEQGEARKRATSAV